jgi:hypothetical protein
MFCKLKSLIVFICGMLNYGRVIGTQVLSNLQLTTLFLFASTLKEVYWFIGMLEKRTKIFSSNNSCGVLQCNEI